MSKIKICGLRRLEDARIVNEGLPDFAGFILTPSKRQVSTRMAAEISSLLSPSIVRVGVFAKETPLKIAQTSSELDLDIIQLHLDTTPVFLEELKEQLMLHSFGRIPLLWQRIPVPVSEERIRTFAGLTQFDRLLLDTCHEGQDGGTGMTFPWQPAADFIEGRHLGTSRMIIAGGLTPENAAQAIAFFNPYAVDVSSGVETDAVKDRDKVLRFIETVRKAQVHE